MGTKLIFMDLEFTRKIFGGLVLQAIRQFYSGFIWKLRGILWVAIRVGFWAAGLVGGRVSSWVLLFPLRICHPGWILLEKLIFIGKNW